MTLIKLLSISGNYLNSIFQAKCDDLFPHTKSIENGKK